MSAPALRTYKGSCHCARIRIEVDAPQVIDALECNCSICKMAGFVHLIVPRNQFRLLAGADALREYSFNTGVARHTFCAVCGIKVFYVPRSNPDGIDVNVRCLEAVDLKQIRITQFDDTNRDAASAAIAHLSAG